MYPLFVDLRDRLAVVIGGGTVGRRKTASLRSAGARVRLVCLEGRPATVNDPALEWRTETYAPHHLDGAVLAFAAGPPELNARVVADCRSRGVWVNAASGEDRGDFVVPATVRRGGLVIAVSTGGAAPALAATLRRRFEAELDGPFDVWLRLLVEMRGVVQERISEEDRRHELMRRLCEWPWLERLRVESEHKVREAMRVMIEAGPTDSLG
jgi:precorrin-2 dehydrogenase/sirohydrochlorin ferrochelatase